LHIDCMSAHIGIARQEAGQRWHDKAAQFESASIS
jgi:hypothetical protein